MPINETQAALWLRKSEEGVRAGKGGAAARQGLLALARMYVLGSGGLPCDPEKANELFKLAAAAGELRRADVAAAPGTPAPSTPAPTPSTPAPTTPAPSAAMPSTPARKEEA